VLEWLYGRARRRPSPEPPAERLARRYAQLRVVLAANNDALELISELENDLLLLPPRDPKVRDRVQQLLERSGELVCALDQLSGNRFGDLTTVLAAIRREIGDLLADAAAAGTGEVSRALAEVGDRDQGLVGCKAANLARLRAAGFRVPDGFVLTTAAYHQLASASGLNERLRRVLHCLDASDLEALDQVARDLHELVLAAPLPPSIETSIRAQLRRLMCRASESFAVRSSAAGEDGVLTFAGQFDSRINVPQEQLVQAYREVCASHFNARAIAYRLSAGVPEVEGPMAVLFLRMIDARSSGVIYTRDPSDPRADAVMVTSSWGAGFTGDSTGDRFLVSRRRRHPIMTRQVGLKSSQTVFEPAGGTREEAVPTTRASIPSVDDEELAELAALALRVEHTFGAPQDVEWAIDRSGQVWVLQARLLRLSADRARVQRAPRVAPLLTGGITIYPGRVSGPVHVAESARDLAHVPDGAVAVLRHTCPECVRFLPRIGGLVVDFGNPAGHAAALIREFRVPALFDAAEATQRLAAGTTVSLDAAARRVYPGQLFPADAGDRRPERHSLALHPLGERITALRLLDPKAWSFRPASCRSVHDIVRFAHEKAIEAVFALGDDEFEEADSGMKLLESPVPIDLHVLDLGGGLVPEVRDARRVRPEQIRSIPFRALWRGMSHPEVSWAGREYVSLSGFASVVARAMTDRATESRELGARSYVAIGEDYVNFNSRLAYHYALVDACVGGDPSSSFVNFRFKGGGADPYRKHLRARFIEECLRPWGYSVDVRQDLVNAWLKRRSREATEERLDVLGRLMACSRQLDMFMASEATMRWYVEQFTHGNYRFRVTGDAPAEIAARGDAPAEIAARGDAPPGRDR
jgi:pyruvate, water dikinase